MPNISFDSPDLVHLIWLAPILWTVYWMSRHTKKEKLTKLLGEKSFQAMLLNENSTKKFLKNLFFFIAWSFLVVTAMGPRWGLKLEEVSQKGLDLMVCLDVSRSMLAEDVIPNRLERTKLDLRDLIQVAQGDRVGLIAFAGAAVSVCPLTHDRNFFKKSLDQLSPASAPRGGTFIGDAIRKALESFAISEGRTRVILVVTDGEDQDSLPLEAARQALSQNVRVFTIGIGDRVRGTPIPITENGLKRNITYQGEVVLSKLNDSSLKEIATLTQGAYIPAGTSLVDLADIYQKHIAPLERVEEDKQNVKRLQSQFQWFLLVAIIFLTLDCLLGTRRQTRIT